MSIVRWFAYRDYNRVDVFTLALCWGLIRKGQYATAIVVWIIGATVSVMFERISA